MNDFTSMDIKLKQLIDLCLQTKNYKKLSVMALVLNNNIILKIGLKLAINPILKDSNDNISRHMTLINDLSHQNFKIFFFSQDDIVIINKIEKQFFEKKGKLSIDLIKKAFSIYYDLRKLDIPNVRESLSSFESPLSNFKIFSKGSNGRNHGSNGGINQLILQKINNEEFSLADQVTMSNSFNSQDIKNIIHLKKMKKALTNQYKTSNDSSNAKIKDFMEYQSKSGNFFLYAFLIASIIFFCFGTVILIETIVFPFLLMVLSPILLIFFGFGLLSILSFNYFSKGV